MDDDIQFLGIVPSFSPTKSYVHPSHPPLQPPASGIMLVIPKTTDEPTQTLRFLKSRSAVVHIGRASSSLVSDAEKSPDTVQFRCPVISRRHAKLMFSSGHVYIVDLHSHHGTHLLRRDEIVSRPILPDVPIVLQDGDTLTFGKAVGKEPYSVSPITANVMLIYDTETGPTSPATPPIISLVDSPSPTTPIKSQQPVAAPKSSSSGRYGLFGPRTPCSPSLRSISSPNASSEEDFSQSDHDVEEDEDEDDEDDYPEIPEDYPFGGHGQAQSAGACYAPLPSLQGLGLLASRHVMHHAPPTHIHPHASHTHINMHVQSLNLERRPSLELWFEGSQRLAAPITANLSHEVGAEEPMDISSPPSPNPLHNLPAEVIENALASVVRTDMYGNPIPEEPPIIGAYPGSPIRSAVVSPWVDSEDVDDDIQCEGVPDRLVLDQPQQSGSQKERENASVAVEGTPASSVIAQASESADHLAEDGASDIDADGEADVDPAPPVEVAASFEPAPLAVPVAVVGPSSSDTHAPPDVGAITGSGMTIDARVTSLDEALVNLWGNVLRMQIAHRKTQTDHKLLSDRTEALAARLDAVQADLRSALCGAEDAEALRARVKAADDLLADLQGRLSSAEAAIAEAKAQAVKNNESDGTTGKRKRDDDDDAVAEEVAAEAPKEVQPRKRTRFAWAAVHTASAAAVGAVAAWSALAFA